MKIKREGIYKTIDSKDFGIYQKSGWEKVVESPLPKLEEVEEKVEPVVEYEPVREVVQDEMVDEVVDKIPKPKRIRKNA